MWKGFSLSLFEKKRKNRRVVLTKLIPYFHSAHDLLLVSLSSRSLSTSFSISILFDSMCVCVCVSLAHCMCLTSPKWRNIVLSLPIRHVVLPDIQSRPQNLTINKVPPPLTHHHHRLLFHLIAFFFGLLLISFCFVSFSTLWKWKKKFPLLQ